MNYIQTEIDGVWIIEPKVFTDARGYFMEAFKEEEFRATIGDVNFIQDNESKSHSARTARAALSERRILPGEAGTCH